MPYTKIYVHLIWATKNRKPLINRKLKPVLLQHIINNSKEKGIFILKANCIENHIHILVSMGTEQTICKIVMLLKGESSFWVNKHKLLKEKFEWQDEYIAVSVCHSMCSRVIDYIINQEDHHKKKTYTEEYDELLIDHHLKSFLAKANTNSDTDSTT